MCRRKEVENKKLLDALKTIKKECTKYEDCSECPLYDDRYGFDNRCESKCLMDSDTPNGWRPFDWIESYNREHA